MIILCGINAKNRPRILAIRDGAPTAARAFARILTDPKIIDDGDMAGRLQSILDAKEHPFMPGLHIGIEID